VKYFVTGSEGFIGTHLVRHLKEAGHEVVTMDLNNGRDQDVSYAGYVRAYMPEDTDRVIHLAALSRIPAEESPTIAAEYFRHNVQGTFNVLNRAAELGVGVVFASTSCLADPGDSLLNQYALTKSVGEQYCWFFQKQTPVSVVRIYNVFGPGEPEIGSSSTVIGIFKRLLREGKPLTIRGTGRQRRDFVHVNDVCRALHLASDSRGLFHVGTGTSYSVLDIANAFGGPQHFIPARPGELLETVCRLRELAWEPEEPDVLSYVRQL
jgi:UDP-glucose 4-epimerase